MQNIFDAALSPFYGLNMAHLYSKYGQFIDGVIFFPIFLGLSQHAFGKRFGGRPGKAISVAFAFALTIALLILEWQLNFNLKSFGGLAIGVVLLMTGYFVMTVGRAFGMGPVTAFCSTYSLMYLSVATAIPNLFDYIANRAPWLNGLLGIIFIISVLVSLVKIFRFVFTGKRDLPHDISGVLTSNSHKNAEAEDQELKFIKESRLKVRTITDMMDALVGIEKVLREGNLDENATARIRAYLHDMSTKEHIFTQRYNQLILNFKKLGLVDSDRLHRLETELQDLPENRRHIKQAEIDIEKRKIEYDSRIIEAKSTLDGHIQAFNASMRKSMQTLSDNDIHQSKNILLSLKKHCDGIDHMTREVIELNKMQKGLFKSESRKRR